MPRLFFFFGSQFVLTSWHVHKTFTPGGEPVEEGVQQDRVVACVVGMGERKGGTGERGEAFWMYRERGKETRGVAEAVGSVGGSSLGWGVCVLCDEVGEWLQHSTAPTDTPVFLAFLY